MSSIIEKLGITPGHYETRGYNSQGCNHKGITTGHVDYSKDGFQSSAVFTESPEIKRIKDAAPEMLERDVKFMQFLDDFIAGCKIANDTGSESTANIIREAFDFTPDENATGLTWEQVREKIK